MPEGTPPTPKPGVRAGKIAKIGAAVQKWRTEAKAHKTALDAATAKIAALEARPTDQALTARVAELEGERRTGKHRSAWDQAAKAAGVRPDALDDAYAASGYAAEGDAPDEGKVKGSLDGLKSKKSYFFGEAKAEETPAKPLEKPAGAGQGGRAGNPADDRPDLARDPRRASAPGRI